MMETIKSTNFDTMKDEKDKTNKNYDMTTASIVINNGT